MARATTKSELNTASELGFKALETFLTEMSETALNTPFDFSQEPKKKEAHWARDKNPRDVLIHLYEWHQLLLNWVSSNLSGKEVSFLRTPYNWRTYGDMNVEFWNEHQNTSFDRALTLLKTSHHQVMALADTFSDEQLFQKDVYPWVGGSTLGSYFVSTTSSHYDWALRKLKAHVKNQK